MTDTEIRQLLAVVMAYDNRKPGDAAVLAWSEAARRGRWTYPAALEAVHEHYARSTAWLMPGHITELIRADRRHPAPVHEVLLALPPAEQATADQRAAAIAAFAQQTAAVKSVDR